MKKVLFFFAVMFFITGCNEPLTPSDYTNQYLLKYQQNEEEVNKSLDQLLILEDLTTEGSEVYRNVLKRQYHDLSYNIIKESFSNDSATVLVHITVYDLFKAQQQSLSYFETHQSEFLNDLMEYDKNKFLNYQLKSMLETNNRVDYEITFSFQLKDSLWVMEQPNKETLEKIHGIFEY